MAGKAFSDERAETSWALEPEDRLSVPSTIAITGRSYRIKDSLPPAPESKKTRKINERSTAGAAS